MRMIRQVLMCAWLAALTGLTVCGALIARETVAMEKPACAATSRIVGIVKIYPVENVFFD